MAGLAGIGGAWIVIVAISAVVFWAWAGALASAGYTGAGIEAFIRGEAVDGVGADACPSSATIALSAYIAVVAAYAVDGPAGAHRASEKARVGYVRVNRTTIAGAA